MTQTFIIGLGMQSLWLVLKVAGPLLAAALVSGLLISTFQATTQINEQTMTFVPKIIVVAGVLAAFGPWMLGSMVEYTRDILANLTSYVH